MNGAGRGLTLAPAFRSDPPWQVNANAALPGRGADN